MANRGKTLLSLEIFPQQAIPSGEAYVRLTFFECNVLGQPRILQAFCEADLDLVQFTERGDESRSLIERLGYL